MSWLNSPGRRLYRSSHCFPDRAAAGRALAAHLVAYVGTPDLLVNSMYDAERDEIAPFEELVGAHGGLGGDQTRPFVMFPAGWQLDDQPIVGPVSLHALLKRWVNAQTSEIYPAQAEPVARAVSVESP